MTSGLESTRYIELFAEGHERQTKALSRYTINDALVRPREAAAASCAVTVVWAFVTMWRLGTLWSLFKDICHF